MAYNNRGNFCLKIGCRKEADEANKSEKADEAKKYKKIIIKIKEKELSSPEHFYDQALSDFKRAIEYSSDDFIASRKELYITAHHEDLAKATLKLLLKLHISVQDIKQDLVSKSENQYYSHYTTLDVLYKLLHNKDSRFRLQSTSSMNDPNEGKVLTKLIPELESFYDEGVHPYIDKHFAGVGSFVKQDDTKLLEEGDKDLHYWRHYGDDANGAKLIFPAEVFETIYDDPSDHRSLVTSAGNKLEDIVRHGRTPVQPENLLSVRPPLSLYKVRYTDNDFNEEELRSLRDSLVPHLTDLEINLNNNNQNSREYSREYKETLIKLVRFVIDDIRYFYKDRFYKDEEEYRIIWVRPMVESTVSGENPLIKQDPDSGRTYMEVEDPDFPFNDKGYVFIGTTVPKKEEHVVTVKYKLVKRENFGCKVKASTIAYEPQTERTKFVAPKQNTEKEDTEKEEHKLLKDILQAIKNERSNSEQPDTNQSDTAQ